MHKSFSYIIVACLFLTTFGFSSGSESKSLVITQGLSQDPFNPCKERVAQAYQRLGIETEFWLLPMRRGLDQANKGNADADLCRIKLVEEHYQDLVRVDAPLTQMKILPVTLYNHPDIEGFQDIHNYLIGSVRGVQAVELAFPDSKVHYEEDLVDLFRLLEKRVIDVLLVAEVYLKPFLQKNPDLQIKVQSENAQSYSLYHFIHKKHQELVPKLESELRKPVPLKSHQLQK